jgi:hypothetical protein
MSISKLRVERGTTQTRAPAVIPCASIGAKYTLQVLGFYLPGIMDLDLASSIASTLIASGGAIIGNSVQQLRDALEQTYKRSTSEPQEALIKLTDVHGKNNLVLVLGAGASMSTAF